MKVSEFLEDVGRPVTYHPRLAKALGGVKEAALLCHLFYWSGRGTHEDGWIYKSRQELEDETGLSFREQERARKVLRDLKVLEEHYERLRHRLFFRVNTDVLKALWEDYIFWETSKVDTEEHSAKQQKRTSGKPKRCSREE